MSAANKGTPATVGGGDKTYISISPLLKRLSTAESTKSVAAEEVAAAMALVFADSLSPVQLALLLWALHTTEGDTDPKVLSQCAAVMRDAAAQVDETELMDVLRRRASPEAGYNGGLCDIVGTGGDGHHTYNVSTTSSIIASALLLMAKHGNNSSTSLSGSADLLQHARPSAPTIAATTNRTLSAIYARTNYAFLYAREWHPGMRYAAAVRKQVPVRTIMNLLGPLANPMEAKGLVEARLLGVAKGNVGMKFAQALKLGGARKGMVVCGKEDLDEISCAGPTTCWLLRSEGEEVEIEEFTVAPEDFGLPRHGLEEVGGGRGPEENAEILMRILRNEMDRDDAVLHFVLLNVAALLVVSGICEADSSQMGAGDDGIVIRERGPGGMRWKEGVRRARWCVESGQALRQWNGFVEATNELGP